MLLGEFIKMKIATILDDEGSISWNKTHKCFHIRISNTNRKYLEWIKNMLGVGCIMDLGKTQKGTPIFQFGANCLQGLFVCLLLEDYLWLKKDKAEKVIEHYNKKIGNASYRWQQWYKVKLAKYNLVFKNNKVKLD